MPSSSDQTRVGRTLIFGGGTQSSLRAETSNSRSRRMTSVLRHSDRRQSREGGPMVRIRFPPAKSPRRNLMPTISAQPAEVADPPQGRNVPSSTPGIGDWTMVASSAPLTVAADNAEVREQ